MIDASIPLGYKGFTLADLMDDAQKVQMRQMQMGVMQRKQDQQAKLSDLFPKAINGDQEALNGIAGVDPDTYLRVRKLLADDGDATGERTRKKYQAAGPLLMRMKSMPYEQRRAFVQQASPVLLANGWKPEELSGFDPTDQAIDSLSTAMMTVGQVIDSQKISWHPVGENGSFATDNLGNPTGAGNPFAGGAAPTQTKTIGAKTYYQTPDGKWHDDMPGGAGSGQPGFQP